jgi:hypothetical protein
MRTARYLLLLAAAASAQTCLPFNQTVSIAGVLARVDENGYRQWIALRPTVRSARSPARKTSSPDPIVT